MATHIVLLRAVNVTGTGKLQMAELRRRVSQLGYDNVRTYIASGNLLVDSAKPATRVKQELGALVAEMVGKPVGAILRTPAALAKTVAANPFPEAEPARVLVLFLDRRVSAADIADVETPGNERLAAVGKEIFFHFPNGMGQSRLKLPFANVGTGRNLNTVRALIALARKAR